MNDKGKTYSGIKKFRKRFLRVLLGIVVFIIIISIVLSLPAVQTAIARKVTNSLNKDFGTNINIDRVHVTFYGGVSLKKVYIEDEYADTLIYAQTINTNLLGLRSALNNNIKFGDVKLSNAFLNIKTYPGDRDTNLDVFVAKFDSGDTTSTQPFLMSFTAIELENSRFKMSDLNKEEPVILNFYNLHGEIDDFRLEGPRVFADIQTLGFDSEEGFELTKLKGNFTYTRKSMELADFHIITPNSNLKGDLRFDYDRSDFADFENKVKLKAKLVASEIGFNDVNVFYNEFGNQKKAIVSGDLSGTLNELLVENIDLTSGNSTIKGNYKFYNLTDSSLPFKMEGDVQQLTSSYYDVTSLMPNVLGTLIPTNLKNLGSFTVTGTTVVTANDIDADVVMNTSIGKIQADALLTNVNNSDFAGYKGNVQLEKFNIGKFLNDPTVGTVTLNALVDGTGFNKNSLNTEVKGYVKRLYYNGYAYKNINVEGRLRNQLFDGYLKTNDKNFNFTFQGLADLSQERNKFNFTADVEYADLNALNFIKRDSLAILKGNVVIDIVGNTVDDIEGSIAFHQTNYTNQNDDYYFEDFAITSQFIDSVRVISINSPDIVSGNVRGTFKYAEIGMLFENAAGSIYPNYSPHKIGENQFIEFNFKIYDKIVDVFYPEIEFGPNTSIRGNIVADEGQFKLTFKSPHISAYDYVFDNINLQVDNQNPLFNTFVEVGTIDAGFYTVKDFNLINSTIKDTLFFRTEFKGGKNIEDAYNLNFYHTFNKDNQSVVGLKKSDLSFKGNTWFLNEENNNENRVVINKDLDSIIVEKIKMTHNDEEINLRGQLIDTTYKDLNLEFKSVDLNKVTPAIDSLTLGGIVNGDLHFLQKKDVYFPTSSLTIDQFQINDKLLGDFAFDIAGNQSLTNYNVDIQLINDKNIESLRVFGDVNFDNTQEALNLRANLKNMDMSPFSPLGGEIISNLRGFVTGDATIRGNVENPSINGVLNLFDAGLTIPFLGLDTNFSQASKVILDEQSFNFDNVTLTDTKYNTSAAFDGSISHKKFSDWALDFHLETNNDRFLVLNTKDDGESLYYGTAFLNGFADMYGPVDALKIEVTGATERGTSFKIPISDAVSIGDDSFVHFINKGETEEEARERMLREYTGIELMFDLTVTPKAEIEIVTDRKTGSTLRGRGEGALLLEINTNGKFNMWGDFLTTEGKYNFKNYGLIDKTFTVEPGGSITWDGDPTRATLRDLKAKYTLNANPSMLLENNQFNRKIKTDVIINLEGNLMNPTTSFDIEFPDTNPVMASELNYRLQDQDRRQLQAIYLLSSGTFVGDDNTGALSGVATTTISESLFSRLNNELGGAENKFNIAVSYEIGTNNPAYEYQTDDQFGVSVSTQLSEKILLNAQVGVPVGGVTETVVAGDVEVQFLLNEEGTLSAKIFNRQTEIQDFLASTQGYTQGVGLSYQVDFNTFKELWQMIFKPNANLNEDLDNDPEKERQAIEAAKQAAKKEEEIQGDGLIRIKAKNKKGDE